METKFADEIIKILDYLASNPVVIGAAIVFGILVLVAFVSILTFMYNMFKRL